MASLIVVMGTGLWGCGGKSDVPVGDAAERIRKLALAYVQYAASHQGVGPKDQAVLTKYLIDENQLPPNEAAEYFVSPRDNAPYLIHWGQRPLGAPIGPNPPQPTILIAERTGHEGTRYIADGLPSVKEYPMEECESLIPSGMK